jgi:hypothetical protein
MKQTNNIKCQEIPLDATEFTSEETGIKYIIETNLSELPYERAKHIDKYMAYFVFGTTWEVIVERLVKALDLLDGETNKEKNQARTLISNLIDGMTNADLKYDPAFWICSLAMNRSTESFRGDWDKNIAKEKIEDWSKNFKQGFFLHFAASCAVTYPNLNNITFLESLIEGKSTKEVAVMASRMMNLFSQNQ